MSKIYKVVSSLDSDMLDEEVFKRAQAGLILKCCNPIVSLSFLKGSLSLEEGYKLGEMAGIKYTNEGCYDRNENFIDRNFILMTIVDDLYLCVKKSLEQNEDNGYFLANSVKKIIDTKVLSKLKDSEKDTITVDDLMSKLYGEREEKGMVK